MRAEFFSNVFGRKAFGKRIIASLFAAAALWACSAPAAFAQQPANAAEAPAPVALLIGNSTYPDAGDPLKHPLKDAGKLADELKKRGFDVLPIGQDLTREQMRTAIDTLCSRIRPGSVALIYYSGYGLQSANGRSYMIPSNAQIWSDGDVRRDGVDVQSVLDEMSTKGAVLKIAILDASRKTPWERRFRDRSIGLAPVVGNKGTIVMYSAAPNTVVDDEDGENSLFMRQLLKGIQAPGLTVEGAFFRTRNEVSQASKGEQVPWVSSFVMGDVYINPPAQTAQQQQPQPAQQQPSRPDPCAAAESHWKSTEAMGTKIAYADHLVRFPSCPFATLAQAKIDAFEQQAAAASAAAAPPPAPPSVPAAVPAPQPASVPAQDVMVPPRPALRNAATSVCGMPSSGQAQIAMGGPFVPVAIRPDLNAAKSVRTIEFSPDGSKFATAGDDGMIRLWDASTFQPIGTLKADQDPIYSIAFWTDGSLLASASATGMVRVWRLDNGRVVNTFRAGSDTDSKSLRQFGVAFYPGKSLQFVDSVGDDGRVWIWDLQQNNLRKMRQNLVSKPAVDPTVRSISFAPNPSGEFVTASFDGAIRFYTGRSEPDTFEVYSGKALRVAYSPDGRYVVSAGVDKNLKNLKVWDAKSHTVVRNLDGHNDYVISAAWSADGTRIVSGGGGKDKVVRVWDAVRGTQIQALVGHHDDVEAVAFYPGKNWVVSVSEDKTLKVWDVAKGRELVSIVAFTDGEYLAYTPLGCYGGSAGAEAHFKLFADGVARDVTSENRKALFVPGGVAPLLTAMER
jgi:WD40 repeat protein